MSKVFKYVANQKGTLNNPYRFVEAGEIVISPVKIEASWLVPAEEYKPSDPLPVTPIHERATAGKAPAVEYYKPTAAEDSYQAQIEKLQEAESLQDQQSQDGESGTGSKTVL